MLFNISNLFFHIEANFPQYHHQPNLAWCIIEITMKLDNDVILIVINNNIDLW